MYGWLQRVWYEDAATGLVLRPLGWLFGAIAGLRRWMYRTGVLKSYSAGKPVIVIGNLTVGGTGKTPLTLWLAQQLAARGIKAGIAMRGYQAGNNTAPRLVRADDSYEDVGDEALLLARRGGVPVVIGRDRVAAAKLLADQGVDVVLADDGLQHLRLKRDFEIVVVDGARRFGNGRLLPAGPLRDPVSRLQTVDAVIVNGAASAPAEISMAVKPADAVPLAGGAPRALASFAGASVHAVAGIGNPGRFFQTLRSAGIQPIPHPHRDHAPLTRADVDFPDALPVLMTEKDAVKCIAFFSSAASSASRHWFVPIDASVAPADAEGLLRKLLSRLKRSINRSI